MTITDFIRPLSRFALAAGIAGVVGLAGPVAVSYAQEAPATEAGPEGDCGARRGHHRGHHRGGHHMGPMHHMGEELQLSEAQQTQIRAIMGEAHAQRGEERGPGAHAAVRARIDAVLTAEQRARAAELRREHSAARIDHHLTRMTERLSLTDTQQQQVRGILRNTAMQRHALMDQASDDPTATHDAMRGLDESTHASIRSVLNSEQAEQLDALHAERAAHGPRHGRHGHGRHGHRGHHGPRGAAPAAD